MMFPNRVSVTDTAREIYFQNSCPPLARTGSLRIRDCGAFGFEDDNVVHGYSDWDTTAFATPQA
jgi:hypothetical protein